MPERTTIGIGGIVIALLIIGFLIVNIFPVSNAYCQITTYVGGTPGSTANCGGRGDLTTGGAGSTPSTSVTSSSSESTATSSSSSSSQPITATLSVASNSIAVSPGGISSPINFILQTTGPVNMTSVGASGFSIIFYPGLSYNQQGSYTGSVKVIAPDNAKSSSYPFTIEAVNNGQIVANASMNIVVGGSSTYYCDVSTFSENITRGLITSSGYVSSSPLNYIAPSPSIPSVEYITTFNGTPIANANGTFIVQYEALGLSSGLATQGGPGQVIASGDNWDLYSFTQEVPLKGGGFTVAMNTTSLIQGEYNAANDPSVFNELPSSFATALKVAESGQLVSDPIFVQTSILGCNSQTSTLRSFYDYVFIPSSAQSTETITCPKTLQACPQNVLGVGPLSVLNLPNPSGFQFIAWPSGPNFEWILAADLLVVFGIILGVGFGVYKWRES